MVLAARDAGLEYIAITDHSKALAMANGLDEARALAHAARIRELDRRIDGIRVLAGIECDILADGSMDLAADCLAELDLVIALGALGDPAGGSGDHGARRARHRASVGRHHRAPDQPHAPAARSLARQHRSDRPRRRGAWRGARDQLSDRSARPLGRQRPVCARARRQAGDLERRPFAARPRH